MEYRKPQFDILSRITEEREKRGWNEKELADRSGLRQSVISTWYNRELQPSVASLERICAGFGMTLSELHLMEDERTVILNESQREVLDTYQRMTPTQREYLLGLMKSTYE